MVVVVVVGRTVIQALEVKSGWMMMAVVVNGKGEERKSIYSIID